MGKKILFTLNTSPDEYKQITDLTYPLLKYHAWKIGAEFCEINSREYHGCPSVTYEKVQVYDIARKENAEWAIFVDSDALIHPDTPDFTEIVPKDTVAHHGMDFAGFRWKYDKYFHRDGRAIGSCTWFCMASEWCLDLYRPIDDMTWEEIDQSIFPILREVVDGVRPIRLIEDYVFSRNIAKYGLKFMTLSKWMQDHGMDPGRFFWHEYAVPAEEKAAHIKLQVKKTMDKLKIWGMK